ncbi:hypothetical protein SORBI_3008G068601 [Sorghum bicolor]|uniref:Uncharacterized protein n=1 Tax=Sorghum bicolor TaxID=4558 RepID=A0A1Z5R617_SORBI|nr:hypothetical protein SORBI_3008G068601 [Sorghum bicolor]
MEMCHRKEGFSTSVCRKNLTALTVQPITGRTDTAGQQRDADQGFLRRCSAPPQRPPRRPLGHAVPVPPPAEWQYGEKRTPSRHAGGWLARSASRRRRRRLGGEKDKLRLTGCTVKTVASPSAVQSPAAGTEHERRVGRGVERHEQEHRVAAGTEQEQEHRVRPLGPLNNPRSSWLAGKQRDV